MDEINIHTALPLRTETDEFVTAFSCIRQIWWSFDKCIAYDRFLNKHICLNTRSVKALYILHFSWERLWSRVISDLGVESFQLLMICTSYLPVFGKLIFEATPKTKLKKKHFFRDLHPARHFIIIRLEKPKYWRFCSLLTTRMVRQISIIYYKFNSWIYRYVGFQCIYYKKKLFFCIQVFLNFILFVDINFKDCLKKMLLLMRGKMVHKAQYSRKICGLL